MITNDLDVAAVRGDNPSPAVAELTSAVTHRVVRVGARYRLDGVLRRIAMDLLGGSGPDELPTAVSSWVQAATDAAVAAVCDTSLAALVEEIDAQLAKAPADVVRRLDDMATRHDAGII
jgi:hypothetical protein